LDLNPARRMRLGQALGLAFQGPLLNQIEVQNVDGTPNVAATTLLWNFMLTNPGKIFYNDVPSVAKLSTCYSACATSAANYNPPFRDYTKNH
jgi:hypothetical protein